MSTLYVVALLVLLTQFVVHFWRKKKLSGEAKTMYNHAMMVGNLLVLYVLLHSYMKTKKVCFILPMITYLAIYLIHGHNTQDTGEAWSLAGGIAVGALSCSIKL